MGQAKARGTYDERKAQAIARNAEQRIKAMAEAEAKETPNARAFLGRGKAAKLLSIAALAGGFGLLVLEFDLCRLHLWRLLRLMLRLC